MSAGTGTSSTNGPSSAVPIAAVQRRTLGVLSAAQVLSGLGVALGGSVGGLIAAEVAGTDAVAGLAQTMSVLGAALVAVPLAWLTRHSGRRAGMLCGFLTGAVGSAVVLLGSALNFLPLLLLGLLCLGGAVAAGLQGRYGATDLAPPERTARALSIVVWSMTVGSVVGPNLAGPAGTLADGLGMRPLAGPFLLSFAAFLCASMVLFALLRPDPLRLAESLAVSDSGDPEGDRERPGFRATLTAIATTPRALTGLCAIAASHVAMVSVMVMTPVHMDHGHASLTIIGLVISIHVLGMFGLSPLVGQAADRIGKIPVLVAGALIMVLAGVLSGLAPPHDSVLLGVGLFLLGLGWSCGLVAGSALLSESVPAGIRTSAQGVSDLVMNGCAAAGGALAGVVVAVASYGWLAFGTALLMVAMAIFPLRGSNRNRVRN